MKTLTILIAVSLLNPVAYCQRYSNSPLNNQSPLLSLKLNYKESAHFAFPLQAGFEYGRGPGTDEYGDSNFGYWDAFLDINLHNRTLFLTLAIAQYRSTIHMENINWLPSVGINLRVTHEFRHNIYMHFGFGQWALHSYHQS